MDVLGFNGYNKQTKAWVWTGEGGLRLHALGLEVGAVCSPDHGRKEVLKYPIETNTAIQYGLLGCIYREATRIQPMWLLLNVTGSAMRTACPSHRPPPNPYRCQLSFTLNIASQLLPAPCIQNHKSEDFALLIWYMKRT